MDANEKLALLDRIERNAAGDETILEAIRELRANLLNQAEATQPTNETRRATGFPTRDEVMTALAAYARRRKH